MILNIFIGNMGAGKSFKAEELASRLRKSGKDVILLSFAEPLKTFVYDTFYLSKDLNARTDLNIIAHRLRKTNLNKVIEDYFQINLDSLTPQKKISSMVTLNNIKTAIDKALERDGNKIYSLDKFKELTRTLLQLFGTEVARELAYKNFWVDKLLWKIVELGKVKSLKNLNIIIDDLRFENELEALANLGIESNILKINLYHITAEDRCRMERLNLTKEQLDKQMQHASEKSVEDLVHIGQNHRNIHFHSIDNTVYLNKSFLARLFRR